MNRVLVISILMGFIASPALAAAEKVTEKTEKIVKEDLTKGAKPKAAPKEEDKEEKHSH